jgi:hypothetical protein
VVCGAGVLAAVLAALLAARSAAAEPEFDQRATATASILAGLAPPTAEPALDRVLKSKAFAEHQRWMVAHWSQARRQIDAIAAWGAHELKIPNPHARTLIYPFSGPDFLNAHALFPDHPRYIFFSLERPGALPDLAALGPAQFGQLLADVRSAFRDIFERNYFITDSMTRQLTTPWVQGSVPIMAAMTALVNLRIVHIEPVDLYPELTRAYEAPEARRPRKPLGGVRIDFRGATAGPVHQLYYFSLDATDVALAFYPDFMEWVGRHRPASGLLKSASYLLHDNQFEKTRTMLLATADVIVQDDTGIPYRFFPQPPWGIRLYGRYHPPIRTLRYGFQADLQAAYKARARDIAELPFPFGYHWKGQQSGLLVATR